MTRTMIKSNSSNQYKIIIVFLFEKPFPCQNEEDKTLFYSLHQKNFCKMAYKSSMSCPSMRRYLVLNYIISAVLNFNKHKTCQQKIFTSLTNEKYVLICSFFFFLIHISYLLYFDMNDMVSLDTKNFSMITILCLHSTLIIIIFYFFIFFFYI